MNRRIVGLVAGLAVLLMPMAAYAHVVVTPAQADVAQELVFNVSVPNERQVSVTDIRLLIPSGVTNVLPTTKDGWTITTVSNGSSSDPEVMAIDWSGIIPVGQRQDFSFGAQVPGTATELDWKAYQTYSDGTIVHWDQKPAGSGDANGNAGPYSVTHVVNDLVRTANPVIPSAILSGLSFGIALIAFLLALYAVLRKRK